MGVLYSRRGYLAPNWEVFSQVKGMWRQSIAQLVTNHLSYVFNPCRNLYPLMDVTQMSKMHHGYGNTPDQWEALTGKAELNDFLTLFVAKQITSCAATNRSRAKLLWRRHCETNWLRKNWNYKTSVSVVLITGSWRIGVNMAASGGQNHLTNPHYRCPASILVE